MTDDPKPYAEAVRLLRRLGRDDLHRLRLWVIPELLRAATRAAEEGWPEPGGEPGTAVVRGV